MCKILSSLARHQQGNSATVGLVAMHAIKMLHHKLEHHPTLPWCQSTRFSAFVLISFNMKSATSIPHQQWWTYRVLKHQRNPYLPNNPNQQPCQLQLTTLTNHLRLPVMKKLGKSQPRALRHQTIQTHQAKLHRRCLSHFVNCSINKKGLREWSAHY